MSPEDIQAYAKFCQNLCQECWTWCYGVDIDVKGGQYGQYWT
jgi:hypothetical protein